MSELKTGITAFLSRECSWMFSSLRRCFQPSKKEREKKTAAGFESRSHLSLAYWCLPLSMVGLMTAWKHFQMPPALYTRSRLPESLEWLHIDHWIVTNDSSGLEFFFFSLAMPVMNWELLNLIHVGLCSLSRGFNLKIVWCYVVSIIAFSFVCVFSIDCVLVWSLSVSSWICSLLWRPRGQGFAV